MLQVFGVVSLIPMILFLQTILTYLLMTMLVIMILSK